MTVQLLFHINYVRCRCSGLKKCVRQGGVIRQGEGEGE